MQTDQDSIYYLFSPSRHIAEKSPYFELFQKENKEILLLSDPADELCLLVMNEFAGKKIVSVEQVNI
jgi:HSP90 family molecular chaperone